MFRIKSFFPLAIRILFLLLFTACMTIPQLGYAAPSLQTGAAAGAKAGQTTGQLSFADNKDAPAGSFTLALAGVPAPSAGSHYELWVQGDDGTYLDLGKAAVANGQIKFSGATKQNLLVAHKLALLSLEPDQDPSPAISTQILLTSTLPTPMLTALRPLFTGNQSADKGFLVGANFEIRVIVRHIGYLGDALDRLDMDGQNGIKLHAEHIINIIDGPSGLLYGDWDKDGLISDPGDKVGLRVYLEQLKKQSALIADALKSGAAPKELQDQAQQIKTSAEAGQTLIKDIIDVTRKIFADDDAEGAQPHVAEVLKTRDALQQIGTEATDATLQIAVFRFAGVITLPKPAAVPTKPGAAPTATLVRIPNQSSGGVTTTLTATPTQTEVPAPTLPSTLTVGPPAEAQSGATWQNPVDGGEYVLVPGGESTMGASGGDGVTAQEKPEHKVKVGDFWLQRTEVTNAQYGKCVDAGVCTAPTDDEWEEDEYKNFPVAHVDWVQANTYARWAGGRLPSEAEWEHACRGEDARIYPWGNNPPTDKLANFNNNIGESTDVGSYPDGASPFGLLDMSGNVWEWTSSLEKPYPYAATDGREDAKADGKRVVRGGSFYYTQYQLRCSTRSGYLPNTQNQHFGFRVALDKPAK